MGKAEGKAEYKLTTTIMLSMDIANNECGDMNTSGNLTRQVSHRRSRRRARKLDDEVDR